MATKPERSARTDVRSVHSPADLVPRHLPRPGATGAGGLAVYGSTGRCAIPPFSLPRADGTRVSAWDYRQRSNLLIFFHHGLACAGCRAILGDLAKNLGRYLSEETAVLAIGPDDAAAAEHLPLLIDPSCETARHCGLMPPALVIADRYGEIWSAWTGGEAHDLPDQEQVLMWVERLEMQCEECGQPDWPPIPAGVAWEE